MNISCIGILTSGGDSPGMNAAIRSVTRTALCKGIKVKGIYRGYDGLINGDVKEFTTESVSNIIGRGGTILKSARSKEFMTREGREKAYQTMQREGIDALVVIGGNGSLTGAKTFGDEFNIPCIGLPGTIDNDLYGTDITIGYDTTLNTIVDCVDKIRDTANSHERIFFVEVMGRDAGFLAQNSAIASGAEAAIIPEDSTDADQLEHFIGRGIRKSKNSSIVIVSESPGIPPVRCEGVDPRSCAARWFSFCSGPYSLEPSGRRCHRCPFRRSAQCDDRHQEQPDCVCSFRRCHPQREGPAQRVDQSARRVVNLAIEHWLERRE